MNTDIIEKIIFFVIVAILLYAIAKYKIADYRKKKAQKKRFERGNQLETEARYFLKKKGYRIISEQEIHHHKYLVNGEKRESKLILDYVVKRNGKKYIVEVKSGKSAISLKDKNSRRQLLEYDFVIENDGVFLLDMENKNMQLVEFHTKAERKDETLRRVIIIFAIIGIAIPFWELKILIGIILFVIWKYPNKSKRVLSIFPNLKF
ncbi:MAG: hypothetical protein KAH07_10460 [Flavobacteriaceae bacterium]|nr:hypothetical protein [Flavobacteriaceae bacterium]